MNPDTLSETERNARRERIATALWAQLAGKYIQEAHSISFRELYASPNDALAWRAANVVMATDILIAELDKTPPTA